jgi:Na+/H+ antiporter NhaC
LITGIVSFAALVTAVAFLGFATATSNVEPPRPNPLAQFAGLSVFAPVFTASLIGGAVSVWRHQRGTASKVTALALLGVAVPFLLYSLFLLLAFVGVIRVY